MRTMIVERDDGGEWAFAFGHEQVRLHAFVGADVQRQLVRNVSSAIFLRDFGWGERCKGRTFAE